MEKVEITENFIRIPNPKHKEKGCKNLRTMDISKEEKIKALYCIDHKSIKTFLFDREKWSLEEAKRWVESRSKGINMEEELKPKFTTAELQEVEGEKLFVASTGIEDRQGEILSVEGWDLKNYKKNPVLLWAHNHNEPPIGIAQSVGIKTIEGKKALAFKPKFHDITERAKEIAKLVEEGIMRTVSVGYLPIERDGNTYLKQELLEVSFVSVPANPEALALAYSKGISEKTIKEVFEIPEKEEEIIVNKSEFENLSKQINELTNIIKSGQKDSAGRSNDTGTALKDNRLHEVKRSAQIIQKAVELALKNLKELNNG